MIFCILCLACACCPFSITISCNGTIHWIATFMINSISSITTISIFTHNKRCHITIWTKIKTIIIRNISISAILCFFNRYWSPIFLVFKYFTTSFFCHICILYSIIWSFILHITIIAYKYYFIPFYWKRFIETIEIIKNKFMGYARFNLTCTIRRIPIIWCRW